MVDALKNRIFAAKISLTSPYLGTWINIEKFYCVNVQKSLLSTETYCEYVLFHMGINIIKYFWFCISAEVHLKLCFLLISMDWRNDLKACGIKMHWTKNVKKHLNTLEESDVMASNVDNKTIIRGLWFWVDPQIWMRR